MVHDPSFLLKVPDEVTMDIASMVPCGAITAYHASTKLRDSINEAMRIRGNIIQDQSVNSKRKNRTNKE